MNKRPILILGLVASSGVTMGWLGGNLLSVPDDSGHQRSIANKNRQNLKPKSASPSNTNQALSQLRSQETFADLVGLTGDGLYSRLALWLLDASAEDIAAYYQSYLQRENQPNEITDLIFINWTRLDPQAAIAATLDSKHAGHPWWAWACHEPEKAYLTAIETKSGRGSNAVWGAGEFHPEWLFENYPTLPDWGQSHALRGYVKLPDTQNPLESIEFLREHNQSIPERTLTALAHTDAQKAHEIARELKASGNYRYRDILNNFYDTLADTDPDFLEKIAESTPSPVEKSALNLRLFRQLMEDDPAAARDMLEGTESVVQKREQLALLGPQLVHDDPEGAYDFLGTLLSEGGSFSDLRTDMILRPQGGLSYSGGSNNNNPFLDALMLNDPARTLEVYFEKQSPDLNQHHNYYQLSNLAKNWASEDLWGFSDWVGQQEGEQYNYSARILSEQLTQFGEYEAALQWDLSLSSGNENSNWRAENTYKNWLRSDPESATEWRLSEDFQNDPERFPLPLSEQTPE